MVVEITHNSAQENAGDSKSIFYQIVHFGIVIEILGTKVCRSHALHSYFCYTTRPFRERGGGTIEEYGGRVLGFLIDQ
jgi:hypothetical protein